MVCSLDRSNETVMFDLKAMRQKPKLVITVLNVFFFITIFIMCSKLASKKVGFVKNFICI